MAAMAHRHNCAVNKYILRVCLLACNRVCSSVCAAYSAIFEILLIIFFLLIDSYSYGYMDLPWNYKTHIQRQTANKRQLVDLNGWHICKEINQ